MKLIDGKYKVIKKLGEGFGGLVTLAEYKGQMVALKKLQMEAGALTTEEILDNFKREFSVLKELSHPHIVRILDFGFDPKENFYYFTTEYIEGQNIFEATRNLPPEKIEELFVQVLRALGYLHSRRVYHFDIKPPNILVEQKKEGEWVAKLIDFGLTAFRTKGLLVGTPSYMSPEIFFGGQKDGRADLYALGITLYQCLTGKNPFDVGDVKKIVELHRTWAPEAVSTQAQNIPSYLDPILEKMLKKNPAERYHHADQVIRDLNWSGQHKYPLETEATALAYLPGEGQLVGREKVWSYIASYFERVFITRNDLKDCILLSGPPGTGKTRLLKELKYHAQLHTVSVLDLMQATNSDIRGPTILLADDADSQAIAQTRLWLKQFHNHPILIVLAGNNLSAAADLGFQLQLRNFDRPEVAQYVASVLNISEPPDFLIDELFARSEGNPLFLTELLRSLIQSKQVFDNQGRWSASTLNELGINFDKLNVPKTLTEYCRNKYQSLSPGGQKILSAVAIAQAPLERIWLVKFCEGLEAAAWESLQNENLVDLDPISGELKLLNPNFRTWVLQNIPSEELSALHQSLGQHFSKNPSKEQAAWYHLGFGNGPAEERVQNLIKYGETLLKSYRWLEASQIFSSASELAPSVESRIDAMIHKVRALFRFGHRTEALTLLEESQKSLKKERENIQQWRWVQQTFREMGSIYLKEGRLDLARESLQASRVILDEHEENPAEEMILDNFRGSLLFREGKLAEAAAISEETFKKWEALPFEKKYLVQNNELPSIYLAQGKAKEAQELFRNQDAFYQQIGNLSKRSYALYGWAESCFFLKEYDEAVKRYEECIRLSSELKSEELLFHAYNGLGNIAYFQSDWVKASEQYEHALELAQRNGNLDSGIAIAINLAIVFHRQGEGGRASLYLRNVIETLESQPLTALHRLQFLTQGYLEVGQLSLEGEKWVEARDAFRDASRIVRHHSGLERFRFAALSGLARANFHMKRMPEFEEVLGEAEKVPLDEEHHRELAELRNLTKSPTADDTTTQIIYREPDSSNRP